MDLNIYLTFKDNARDALAFYADVLGGEVTDLMDFGEMPGDWNPVIAKRLAHGRVALGTKSIMASDSWSDDDFKAFAGFRVQTAWDTVEEANAAFSRLSEGGVVVMPIEPTFWAAAFGICRDKFGVEWMCNCDKPA